MPISLEQSRSLERASTLISLGNSLVELGLYDIMFSVQGHGDCMDATIKLWDEERGVSHPKIFYVGVEQVPRTLHVLVELLRQADWKLSELKYKDLG